MNENYQVPSLSAEGSNNDNTRSNQFRYYYNIYSSHHYYVP